MELCQKSIDKTASISSRENYILDGVQNKIVKEKDLITDKNSMNCIDDGIVSEIVKPLSPLRFHKNGLFPHKSPTKKSKTVVKLAKLLSVNGNSKEQVSSYSSVFTKRLKNSERDVNVGMHSTIHHHRIGNQRKESAFKDFAKRLLANMLKKKTSSEIDNNKPFTQSFVTKSFRRRSLCEEFSILNDVITTRFESGFINSVTSSQRNAEGNLTKSPSPKKNSSTFDPIENELPTERDHRSAFVRYRINSSAENGNIMVPVKSNLSSGFYAGSSTDNIRHVKRKVLILTDNQMALSSSHVLPISSEYPFPICFPFLPHNNGTKNELEENLYNRFKSDLDVNAEPSSVFDENAFFVLRDSVDSSSDAAESAALDAEVECFMSKTKKRKANDFDSSDFRFWEPVAFTLSFGDNKHFLPIADRDY